MFLHLLLIEISISLTLRIPFIDRRSLLLDETDSWTDRVTICVVLQTGSPLCPLYGLFTTELSCTPQCLQVYGFSSYQARVISDSEIHTVSPSPTPVQFLAWNKTYALWLIPAVVHVQNLNILYWDVTRGLLHVHKHTCPHTRIHTCPHACTCTDTHTCTRIHSHTHMSRLQLYCVSSSVFFRYIVLNTMAYNNSLQQELRCQLQPDN